MRRVLVLAVAAVVVGCADATSPTVLTDVLPQDWGYNGQGPTLWAGKYAVGTLVSGAHSGSAGMAIVGSDSLNASYTGFGQRVKADNYRGKRVRFVAWVRHGSLAGRDIGIWMRVDGPGVTLAYDNFSTRSLRGTSDWHEIEIILDVADNAIGIAFGVIMQGRGELYIDDMRWEIIPASGATTDQYVAPIPTGFDAPAAYATVPRLAPTNMGFELKAP